jgi:hypothetical protein
MEKTHRNRKRPQLWTPVLRTAAAAPYAAGLLSPLLDRLDIVLDLFPVIVTGIRRRHKGAGEAMGLLGHRSLFMVKESV